VDEYIKALKSNLDYNYLKLYLQKINDIIEETLIISYAKERKLNILSGALIQAKMTAHDVQEEVANKYITV